MSNEADKHLSSIRPLHGCSTLKTPQGNIYQIRAATLDDAPIISQYNIQMAKETENVELDPDTILKGCQAILRQENVSGEAKHGAISGRNPRGFYLVAASTHQSVDGDVELVLGQLMVTYEWSDWRNVYIWWIQSVYVVPEHRGQGIFTALYHHVRRMCQDEGAGGLRLYADNDNVNAQKTYMRLGMTSHYKVFEDMFDE